MIERPAKHAGFTLIELSVTLGLLGGFIMALVSLLSGGISLVDEGEAGQELGDRAMSSSETVTDVIEAMVGPREDVFVSSTPTTRMRVEWAPLGLMEGAPAMVQVLRASVRIDGNQERELLRGKLRARASQTARSVAAQDVAARLSELLDAAPRQGRGDMLLLPWPADRDGVFLELRSGLFLPGEKIRLSRRDERELLAIEDLGSGGLPAAVVPRITKVIATGLLHFELSLWSQYTKDWRAEPGDGSGPEWTWDSARAGTLLAGDDPRRRFSLDLGPQSLKNRTDDVFPRWVRVVFVVDRPDRLARLVSALGSGEKVMKLSGIDRLGDPDRLSFFKIGGEWVRAARVSNGVCSGLRRGQRGTMAVAHARGSVVRVGRTVVLTLPIAHGKDDWNG